jgi:hypothetical protein
MSELFDNRKRTTNFCQLVREPIEEANPRRTLTTEETKRLAKLKAITDKPKRGENVQNRQLQTWLSHESTSRLGL